MDRSQLVIALLLSAFIIDRLIASLMFVIDYVKRSKLTDEASQALQTESRRKFGYFVLSGILSALALYIIHIHYPTIEVAGLPALGSSIVLWLILVAGADRISEFIGSGSGSETPAPAPPKGEFHVTGTMQVVDRPPQP